MRWLIFHLVASISTIYLFIINRLSTCLYVCLPVVSSLSKCQVYNSLNFGFQDIRLTGDLSATHATNTFPHTLATPFLFVGRVPYVLCSLSYYYAKNTICADVA